MSINGGKAPPLEPPPKVDPPPAPPSGLTVVADVAEDDGIDGMLEQPRPKIQALCDDWPTVEGRRQQTIWKNEL
jgi:hypothetical protein